MVTRVWVFGTSCDTVESRLIRWLTHGWVSHVGIGFDFDDHPSEYYEMFWDDDFIGPKPPSRLMQWERERGHKMVRIYLPAVRIDLYGQEMYRLAAKYADSHVPYSKLQLIGMGLHERYGWPLMHSPRRMVCSEFVARVLRPGFDVRDVFRETEDEVTPGSLVFRLMAILAAYEALGALEDGQ